MRVPVLLGCLLSLALVYAQTDYEEYYDYSEEIVTDPPVPETAPTTLAPEAHTITPNTLETLLACENESKEIVCPAGTYILIADCYYGRDNRATCPYPGKMSNIHCRAQNAISIIRERCEGKLRCNLSSFNEMFGNPCEDTYKYLRVDYVCRRDLNPSTTPEPSTTTAIIRRKKLIRKPKTSENRIEQSTADIEEPTTTTQEPPREPEALKSETEELTTPTTEEPSTEPEEPIIEPEQPTSTNKEITTTTTEEPSTEPEEPITEQEQPTSTTEEITTTTTEEPSTEPEEPITEPEKPTSTTEEITTTTTEEPSTEPEVPTSTIEEITTTTTEEPSTEPEEPIIEPEQPTSTTEEITTTTTEEPSTEPEVPLIETDKPTTTNETRTTTTEEITTTTSEEPSTEPEVPVTEHKEPTIATETPSITTEDLITTTTEETTFLPEEPATEAKESDASMITEVTTTKQEPITTSEIPRTEEPRTTTEHYTIVTEEQPTFPIIIEVPKDVSSTSEAINSDTSTDSLKSISASDEVNSDNSYQIQSNDSESDSSSESSNSSSDVSSISSESDSSSESSWESGSSSEERRSSFDNNNASEPNDVSEADRNISWEEANKSDEIEKSDELEILENYSPYDSYESSETNNVWKHQPSLDSSEEHYDSEENESSEELNSSTNLNSQEEPNSWKRTTSSAELISSGHSHGHNKQKHPKVVVLKPRIPKYVPIIINIDAVRDGMTAIIKSKSFKPSYPPLKPGQIIVKYTLKGPGSKRVTIDIPPSAGRSRPLTVIVTIPPTWDGGNIIKIILKTPRDELPPQEIAIPLPAEAMQSQKVDGWRGATTVLLPSEDDTDTEQYDVVYLRTGSNQLTSSPSDYVIQSPNMCPILTYVEQRNNQQRNPRNFGLVVSNPNGIIGHLSKIGALTAFSQSLQVVYEPVALQPNPLARQCSQSPLFRVFSICQ